MMPHTSTHYHRHQSAHHQSNASLPSLPSPSLPLPSLVGSARHHYDVIVIGGGHAGCEAAAVSARMGADTLLITASADDIGVMSCNPAFGGLGKGHLLREIDAFDGVCPPMCDKATIMSQVLNRSRGPAVRGPRAQADRELYRHAMQRALSTTENLTIHIGMVTSLLIKDMRSKNRCVKGATLADGTIFTASAVVLTTGTFLAGKILRGYHETQGGRLDSSSALALDQNLKALDLPLGRFRTGTPARLLASSIDFSRLEVQHGDHDHDREPMSRRTSTLNNPQVPCHITHTTQETHETVKRYLHHAAGSWASHAKPPRFCPSIEDKIVRFKDKSSHQVFLEPEGLNSPLIYPNGISSSLPAPAQDAFLRTIPGLQKVRIAAYAYTIEYSYVDPRALLPTLQCRSIDRLWLAGQINGTTGYEEAAALGLMAGINAALVAGSDGADYHGLSDFVLDRGDAYIGVLIDDLVHKGVEEPYRMLTCRAEYRLLLRADNADLRLCEKARTLGCLSAQTIDAYTQLSTELLSARQSLSQLPQLGHTTLSRHLEKQLHMTHDAVTTMFHGVCRGGVRSMEQILALPDVPDTVINALWPPFSEMSSRCREQLRIESLYAPYLRKQERDIAIFRQDSGLAIPSDIVFEEIPGLSIEASSLLGKHRPHTLHAAGQINGVSMSALLTILRFINKKDKDLTL